MGGLISVLVMALVLLPMGSWAQTPTPTVAIELNKLEQIEGACRAYLLFENEADQRFDSFRLELVLFDSDGVIDRRIAVDASPLRARKSVVKLFDLSDLSCTAVSRVLLNDVSPCSLGGAEREDCIEFVKLSSRTEVSFFR